MSDFQNSSLGEIITESTLNIPIVIHILYKNERQNISLQQIKELNNAFANINNKYKIPAEFQDLAGNMEIQFYLASITPNRDSTNGIIRVESSNTLSDIDSSIFYTQLGVSDAWDT